MLCSSPLYGYRMMKFDEYGEYVPLTEFFDEKSKAWRFDYRYRFIKHHIGETEEQFMERWHKLAERKDVETQLIKCGHCIECRLEYARNWANRCMLEASMYENNWFLTLTYDDECLPKNDKGIPTLRKERLTKFMKDLREYFAYHYNHVGIRFFACGEYGDKSGRPHFHLILFNLPLDDAIFLFNKNGHSYFQSSVINDLWPEGFAPLTDVNWNTCAYVARYVVKKTKKELANQYDELGISREFVRMSRVPGIAREYYNQHKDLIYENDKIFIPGAGHVQPSKYFDRLYDLESPCELEMLKDKRAKLSEGSFLMQLDDTSLSASEYQKVKHAQLVKKIESLQRIEI